jgi:hypothetical protein
MFMVSLLNSASALTVTAALVAAALFFYIFSRARRRVRERRILLIVVGDTPVLAGGRALPLPLLLLVVAVIAGMALLAARILVVPALLGAPLLALLGIAILLALLARAPRSSRAYVIEVNVARTRRAADRFIRFAPPGADDSQDELARELRRAASSLRASAVFVALPHHPAWWTGVAHALEVLAELRVPLFALCAWNPYVREVLSQGALLESLVNARYAIVLFEPTRSGEVLSALIALEELDRLYQCCQTYEGALIPLLDDSTPLWDVNARGARLLIGCCPEGGESGPDERGVLESRGSIPSTWIRGARRLALIVYPWEGVLAGAPALPARSLRRGGEG